MSSRFSLTTAARRDLLEIWGYVFDQVGSDVRADRQLAALHSTLETLAERPGLGAGRDWLPRDVLAFPKDGYVIVYRRAGDGIQVLRVTGSEADLLTVD